MGPRLRCAVCCDHGDDSVERDVAHRGTRSAGRGLVEPARAAVSDCASRGNAPAAATPAPVTGAVAAAAAAPSIRVVTDVIDMDISLQGGDLLRADLLQYPRDKKPGSPAVRLLSTDEATYGVVRSGLRAADGRPEPTHLALYTASASEFRLAPGAQELRVPLTWTDGQGVTVTKTYVFKPGQYAVDVIYDVQNASGADWNAASYVQFARHVYSQSRSMFDVESYAFRGPAVYDGEEVPEAQRRPGGRGVPPGVRRWLDGRNAASLRRGRRAAEGRDL